MLTPSRISFLVLFWFSLPFLSTAQQDSLSDRKFWTMGANFGMIGFSPSTQHIYSGNDFFTRTMNRLAVGAVQDNSGKSHPAIIANTSVGLCGGIMIRDKNSKNYTSIEGDFQMNKACYDFSFPFIYSFHGDSNQAWVMTDKYFRYGVSVQRSWYRTMRSQNTGNDSWFYIRESFGQTFDHRNFTDHLAAGHFENWVNNNGNGMTATTVMFNPVSFMVSSEIGIRRFSDDQHSCFDLGIVWHQPFVPTYTDQYEFFRNGASSGVSQITYSGATVMLNLRYTFDKPMKVRPKPSPVINGPIVDHNPKVKPTPVDTVDRKIEVQSTIISGHKNITIKVWDKDEIDGDSITLFLNGQIVKQHIGLRRRKKTFHVHLQPGKNYVVMYAENLGAIPPNTAAVEVKDGHVKKRMTLVSDKGKSGAIEIDTGN